MRRKTRAVLAAETDRFGAALAVSGSYLLAGAPAESLDAINSSDRGAAYVFLRSGSSFTQQATALETARCQANNQERFA
jgi:hypothetical protein